MQACLHNSAPMEDIGQLWVLRQALFVVFPHRRPGYLVCELQGVLLFLPLILYRNTGIGCTCDKSLVFPLVLGSQTQVLVLAQQVLLHTRPPPRSNADFSSTGILTMHPRLASHQPFSCLRFQSAGITAVDHQSWAPLVLSQVLQAHDLGD